MTKLELLAPAKNLEQGIAAINCGADAVYIGASDFGARMAAGNSVEDIIQLINYAHLFHAKVYATINTILYDSELLNVLDLINRLYEAKIDAIIIQDMGILEMELPPINIFASTQTNNRTVEKIKFLEQLGFSRVILARELSLKQIKEINSKTNIDLEFFIHGALCVSYSGQCYFSQEITGRSANRGECAQPCRSSYDLVDAEGKIILKNKHLFSLKDFNLSENIEDLANSGISSFKIEGRLKNMAYVKNVTVHYRKLIDAVIKSNPDKFRKASSGKIKLRFEPNIDSVFNRGFTNYFIDGRHEKLASFDSQKSLGEFIGEVEKKDEEILYVKTDKKLNNNDGLCFFNDGELLGFKINKVVGNKITTNGEVEIQKGAKIYRNYNHQITKEVEKGDSAIRKIQIYIELLESENQLFIKIVDEDSLISKYEISETFEEAQNLEKAIETIKNNLSKEGETVYEVLEVKISTSKTYFFPISKLNEIRRNTFENHNIIRLQNHKIEKRVISKNDTLYHKKRIDFDENVSNTKAEAFYKRHGVEGIKPAYEKLKPVEEVPILTSKYCLKFELGVCPIHQKSNQKFKEPLYIINNKRKFRLAFDCKKCEMSILK